MSFSKNEIHLLRLAVEETFMLKQKLFKLFNHFIKEVDEPTLQAIGFYSIGSATVLAKAGIHLQDLFVQADHKHRMLLAKLEALEKEKLDDLEKKKEVAA